MIYTMLCKVCSNGKIVGAIIEDENGNKKAIRKSDFKLYSFSNIKVASDLKIIGNIPCKEITSSKNKSNDIVLYHGSPNAVVNPTYGLGKDNHDYGKCFYLTPSIELAKEWSVSSYGIKKGYVHQYILNLNKLNILDFSEKSHLSWIAELMKHRDADNSARYKRNVSKFIKKFGIDTSNCDIIKGWRADSSYFKIAKLFVRNEIDYDLLPELLKYGDLGIQYCLKSKKSFDSIKEVNNKEFPLEVNINYYEKYNSRDKQARKKTEELINSERNTFKKGFDYVIGDDFVW